MTGVYAYSPRVLPPLLVILLLLGIAYYSWRRRHLAGAVPFAAASMLAAVWIGGLAMQLAAVDLAHKAFWFSFTGVWQPPTVAAMTCFVLEYAWPGRWLSRRNLAVIFLPSLIFALLVATGNPGGLAWISVITDGQLQPVRGPFNWFVLTWSYALTALEVLALTWLFIRSRLHRWQALLLLGTKLAARSGYLLRTLGFAGDGQLPDDLIVGFVALMYAAALFGFRAFDPVTSARELAIAQMQDGLLVTDQMGRVTSVNDAALEMLGATEQKVLGKDLDSVWPGRPDPAETPLAQPSEWLPLPAEPGRSQREIIFREQELLDFRGVRSGRLILLRDVTKERAAQAKLLEQQRSIATLTERDRLARELHDSLGQTIAAARLQATTAGRLLADGEVPAAEQTLVALAALARDAEVDIREYIVGARTFAPSDLPFFTKLERYLAAFGPQHDLDVRLTVGQELGRAPFPAEMENQLLRIVQEALSNVRKHAAARSVKIGFTVQSGEFVLTIADDGRGFQPAATSPRPEEGYGLQTMRERAETLGGTFELASAPGHGTEITVTVPLKEAGSDV